jgi:Carboxypeptidase regulatory-like domain
MIRALSIVSLLLALGMAAAAQQTPGQIAQPPRPATGGQQPARDTPAQPQDAPPTPTGRITGRVIASDNGRPVKRARVFVSAAELPDGGRGVLTDDQGVFDLAELPAGRYTLTVSKSGFVSLSYGQRRPLQAGTPLQLADGQQIKGIAFQLPRGSVIGGRVLDEDGEAMPGVAVRVMHYQYLQGERRLTPAGAGQTDDKGQYRVWGLMPGDYYVNATARGGFGGPFGQFGPGAFGGAGGPGGGRAAFAGRGGGRGGPGAGAPAGNDQEQINYAPTYFPGVASVNEAKPIAVGLSEEVLDINFNMQLVHVSRITGHVVNPDGTPVTSGNVNLGIDGAGGRGNQIGMNYGGRIQWDGEFTIANVPPGRYMLRARGDDSETPQYAAQPVTISGEDLDDLTVVLAPGATISGAVTFLGAPGASPDPSQFRITAPAADQSNVGPQPNARVGKDGAFELSGVPAGSHLIRSAGNARGFILKSVTVNGRDVTDTPVALRGGETLANVTVVFTDQQNEINGTVTNEQGTAMPDYTVLAFSTDPSLWRPLSRQIMTARPDQTGKYRIRGLPRGDYYLVAVDPAEQGEWFEPAYLDEHRAGAQHLTLGDSDVKTQDFKIAQRQ